MDINKADEESSDDRACNTADMKKRVSECKNVSDYTIQEMEYIQKPVGRANFNAKPREIRANWYDRVKCSICGKEFTRSARTKHNRTQYHLTYAKINKKLVGLLLGQPEAD